MSDSYFNVSIKKTTPITDANHKNNYICLPGIYIVKKSKYSNWVIHVTCRINPTEEQCLFVFLFGENPQAVAYSAQTLRWSD